MEDTFAGRLQYFIERQLFITIRKFEKDCGFSTGVIHRAIKNGANIGLDKLEVIGSRYPELNMDWLILGEGKPTETDKVSGEENNSNLIDILSEALTKLTESDLIKSKSIENMTESLKGMSKAELLRANNEARLITILENSKH